MSINPYSITSSKSDYPYINETTNHAHSVDKAEYPYINETANYTLHSKI